MTRNFIITILIIIFILWNRLLRIRLPIAIEDLKFTYITLGLLVFSIIFCIISIIFSLNTLRVNSNNFSVLENLLKYKPFNYLANCINAIKNSPKKLYNYLADSYINFKPIIELPASYLAVYVCYPKTIIFFFVFLPRILVATVFFLDVVYFHFFFLFYKSLIFLLIPLVIQCYIYMILFYSENNLEFTLLYLNIEYHQNGLSFTLKPEPPKIKYALTKEKMKEKHHYLVNLWRICTVLRRYTELLYAVDNAYRPYVILYTSSCFLIGWLYILIHYLNLI